MKRTLSMIGLAVLTIGLLGSCAKINERLDDLEKKVDGLENEKIASIDSQVRSIESSISDLESIRDKVQAMSDPATGLSKRIDELKAFVSDVKKNYATQDWATTTFVTMDEYEKTCDTVAKIDARISFIDAKLSKDIKACADSLTKWVNEQFGGYYTAAEMDAKLALMKSAVDSAKVDSLAAELTVLAGVVDTAKANIKAEYRAAIDTAFKAFKGKITETLQNSIAEVNGKIESLAIRVGSLETEVNALTGKVKALEGMIQSVTIVPAYSGGRLEEVEGGIMTIDCIISPASAAKSLTKEHFKVLVNTVKSKAVTLDTAKVSDIKIGENGIVSIYAQAPAAPATDSAHTAALRIKDGANADYTTEFHKFGYSGRNVKVVDLEENGEAYKKVYIAPSDASEPEDVEGKIPVEIDGRKTFDGSKSVIEAVGMGIVTFDKTATEKIAENAAGADSISFEVKNVTTPDHKANSEIVYQVTMVDDKGEEVFSESNAAGEVAMEIPLASNVADVTEVTLLDGSGNPIPGGVVYGSIVYDWEKQIVTFKVNHFSQYAVYYVLESDYRPVEGISLDKTSATLEEGDILSLIATITPTEASNKNVIWSSSDTTKVKVDRNGKVKAVAFGKATVTATSMNNRKITATCTVTVNFPISKIKYSKAVYSEEGGAHWEVTMRIDNSDSGYPALIVKAGPAYSGEFIEGDFKILSAVLKTSASESTYFKDNAGTVTITCTESGTASKAGKYNFDIKAKDTSNKNVELVTNPLTTSAKDTDGKAVTLKDKSASDPARKPVKGISFPSGYKPEVAAGVSTQLSFDVNPTDATNPNAYWKSSDESVATVDATGKVTGVGEGSATITATSVDGKKTATCTVSVKSPFEVLNSAVATYREDENGAYWEFDISKSDGADGYPKFIVKAGPAYSGEFIEGDFQILSAVLQTGVSESTKYKDNVGSVTITCTESGTTSKAGKYSFDVKAKDASGKDVNQTLSGVKTTARDKDGKAKTLRDKSASDPVRKAVEGISFPTGYKPAVTAGSSTQLSFNVNPSDATNPNAYWTSSDESVAIVDATGNVRGLKEGTATITATSVDGRKTATCTVTVNKSSISDMKYAKAVYSEEGGAHWEFTMRVTDGDSGYPALIVKAGPAYSGEFIEGDFKILSAVLQTGASESTKYKDNVGSVTVTCTESGTASEAGKYIFDVKAKDASNKNVEIVTNPLTTSAKKVGGELITLKDKDKSDPDYKAVTGISFPNGYAPEVFAKSFTYLGFTVNPSNATNPYAYWTSSDETVATVDAYGKVKGVDVGTATITATSVDGKKTTTCTVTVKPPVSVVYSEEGDAAYWEFTIHRAGGTDGYPEITVKAGPAYSGEFIEGDFNIISAVLKTSASESTDYKANAGTVTITCTKSGTASKFGKYSFDINAKDASDGDVKFTESDLSTRAETTGGVAITLKDKDPLDPDYRAVTSIKISKYESETSVGSSTQMSFTVNPSNATNPYVYWESSDPTVATVDAYGKVKGLKEGTATITITSVNGKKTATCTFNVRRGTEQYDHNDNPYWF